MAAGLALAIAAGVLTLAYTAVRVPTFGFETANRRLAALARRVALNSGPAQVRAQIAEARMILSRDATNVGAVRSLAILYDQVGDRAGSVRLLELAERLSRRDTPTEMALIEVAVARNSIPEALRHYDRAMTTMPQAADTLVPILVAASGDRTIANQVTRIMARRPVWWPRFLDGMIAGGDPAATARIVRALRLRPDQATEGWRLSAAIEKLARAGHVGVALRLAQTVRPAMKGQLGNGGFERVGDLPPFDWRFIDSDGLAAVREQREGAHGDFALSLVASAGQAGPVARQLLLLAPGIYRLRLHAGDLDDGPARPRIALRCASGGEAALADTAIDRTAFALAFTVPRGCSGQWIELTAIGPAFESGHTPWVDDIAVEPAS